MQTQMIREIVEIGQDHHIHLDIELREYFEQQVEVFVVPTKKSEKNTMSDESMAIMKMVDETGFVKNELSDPAEDVWNDYL